MRRSNLFNAAAGLGIQAFLKLVFSVASLKIVTFYAGPAGVAIVGQLQAILQIASAIVSSTVSVGVVKSISDQKTARTTVLSTAFGILCAFSLATLLLLIALGPNIADRYLTQQWRNAIYLVPFAAFFIGCSSLSLSYFNGVQNYRAYSIFSALLSLFISGLTIVLTVVYGRWGAIYSVVIAPIAAVPVLIYVFHSNSAHHLIRRFKFGEVTLIKTLLSFSVMGMTSSIVTYGGQIYLRDFIVQSLSLESSGIWYATTRFSELYMGISSIIFSAILVPQYSKSGNENISPIVLRMLMYALLFSFVMVVSVYVLSGAIIGYMYGDLFQEVKGLTKLYVIGDAIKVVSWVFLYVAIAKQYVKFYMLFEIISTLFYVFFSVLIYESFGLNAMPFGYIAQSIVSLAVVIIWFVLNKNNVDRVG